MMEVAAGRHAFLFDLNACTGCQACLIACAIENELAPGTSWREVHTFNEARLPEVPVFHLSLACNHCAEAPCMEHCPALAYRRDAATGAVLLDPELCIGCKYCSWACPYDAPRFHSEAGVMSKCTFCHHRLSAGLEPACVTSCPTGALGLGDLEAAPGVERVLGFPETGCGPSIRFQPLRDGHRMPEIFPPNPPGARSALEHRPQTDSGRPSTQAPPPSKITLRSEWPLAIFTLLAAVLVGAQTTAALGTPVVPPWLVAALGVLNMGFASLHLGKKLRAWRAILNLRRSWLSREIFFYGAFVASTTASAAAGWLEWTSLTWLTPAAALVGFAALLAIDRVYDVVERPRILGLHSAEVLPTGLLLAAILLGSPPAAVAIAALKLGLYTGRKIRFRRRGRPWRPGWSLARLGAGFALPVTLGILDPDRWALWALLGTAAGEAVDRAEFYTELEVPAPRRQMALDLVAMLRSRAEAA